MISRLLIIALYHFAILNGLEKMLNEQLFGFEFTKRPYCDNDTISCVGLPSGHVEITTIVCIILSYYKYFTLPIALIIIICMAIQRVVFKRHTIFQVIIGFITGCIYTFIYLYNHLSNMCFLIMILITSILVASILYILDKRVHEPIPEWVDPSMLPNIEKKRNTPYYSKAMCMILNSAYQYKTFISWKEIESDLDKLILKLQQTNIKFDAIVGLKTGGAILSDYISNKLDIQNYKIKLTRSEYNCNKTYFHTLDQIVKQTIGNKSEFTICEDVPDLTGKNIILFDEVVSTGTTMNAAIKHLKEKNANVIFPACLAIVPSRFKYKFKVDYIRDDFIMVFPWGYDN